MLLAYSTAGADAPTMPVSEIRPGQQGYGLTVFSGFKVERFSVTVVDVLRGFLPKQDIILIRMDHPRLRKTNVVGGMSGSPIYINDRLVGALAYGWRFAKEPIAGVTPIASMRRLLRRKLRGPVPDTLRKQAARNSSRSIFRQSPILSARRLAWSRQVRHDREYFAPVGGSKQMASASRLVPLSVPLSVAGLSPAGVEALERAFSHYGFSAVQGGGTGSQEGPSRFSAGSAIGIQLVSGDISVSGTGTVTEVRGKHVLAFGHPALNAGELYLPVVGARINHTLANTARSFKLSSPTRVLGTLVQDRQAAIVADTSRRTHTTALRVMVRANGERYVFRTTIARHPLLTPSLTQMVVTSALSQALSDTDHATYRMRTRIKATGLPVLEMHDEQYSAGGVGRGALYLTRGLAAVRRLIDNPYRHVSVTRIAIDIDVKFGQRALSIVDVRLPANRVETGSAVALTVVYRPFNGQEFQKTYAVKIPAGLAGTVLGLDISGGSYVRPPYAKSTNFDQYLRNFQRYYPARSLVVGIRVPEQGVRFAGHLITDLPGSIDDSFNMGTTQRREGAYKAVRHKVFDTQQVIVGRKQVRLRVNREDG